MKKKLKNYVQQDNFSCALYSILYILRTKYWILFNDDQIKDMIKQAMDEWILSETWSIFNFIFNWFSWYFYKKYWVNLIVNEYNIKTNEFTNALVKWNTFTIWLLKANKSYINSKEDDVITLDEINEMKWTNHYGHALTYKYEYIIDSLDWWIIGLDYEVLLKGIEEWIFWQTARSYEIEDKLIHYYLSEMNIWTKFNKIELLDEENQKAIHEAIDLRWLWRKKGL
jgi:hypothetical protein